MSDCDTKIPETLEEAVEAVKRWDGVVEWAAAANVDEATNSIHHFAGRGIRNGWGLWTGSALACHLYDRFGLTHADDMSGLIFHCAWQALNDLPWGAEDVAEFYKKYWGERGGMPERPWLEKQDV